MTGLEIFLSITTVVFFLTTVAAVNANNRHVKMYRELIKITEQLG